MSWNLTAAPSRRAAARLLVAHRAGLVRLGPDEDFCLMVVSSAILVQKMRNKVGRLWMANGRLCPAPGQPGAPRTPDPRAELLAEVLDQPPALG